MKCPRCEHLMVEERVSICLCDMNPPAKIAGVPAHVCPHCGERSYSMATAIRLDEIRDSFGQPHREEIMHVYEFAAPIVVTPEPIVMTAAPLAVRLLPTNVSTVIYHGSTAVMEPR
jgi:hypothetical protein